MGTDIHIIAQVRDKNGEWHTNTTPIFSNIWYNDDYTGDYEDFKTPKRVNPDPGRNYPLFNILTGGTVRYQYDELYSVIEDYDNFTEELDEAGKSIIYHNNYEELKQYVWGMSSLSLTTLKNHDWRFRQEADDEYDQCVYYWGQDYFTCNPVDKTPEFWFTEAPEGNVIILDEENMTEKDRLHLLERHTFVKIHTLPLQEPTDDSSVGFFVNTLLPELETLIPEGGTSDDVRIVYGFDN